MTVPILLPSTVDVVVKWAKSNSNIYAVYGDRISSTLPKLETQRTYPWLTVMRVIGQPLVAEAPMDRARLQFNSLGGVKANGLPNWSIADFGIRTLEAEIRAHTQAVVDTAVIEVMDSLEGIMQLEDPDTGGARFWMDAVVVVRNGP